MNEAGAASVERCSESLGSVLGLGFRVRVRVRVRARVRVYLQAVCVYHGSGCRRGCGLAVLAPGFGF